MVFFFFVFFKQDIPADEEQELMDALDLDGAWSPEALLSPQSKELQDLVEACIKDGTWNASPKPIPPQLRHLVEACLGEGALEKLSPQGETSEPQQMEAPQMEVPQKELPLVDLPQMEVENQPMEVDKESNLGEDLLEFLDQNLNREPVMSTPALEGSANTNLYFF